jgi:DNA polymerase-3 subunit epsilon/CBS domain-containing protein
MVVRTMGRFETESATMAIAEPSTDDRTMAATPLLALDAVALDTETTGLDARHARLVQIGALRLGSGGSIEAGERFERLVDPGVPIPPASTAIHGITTEHVGGAPRFDAVAPELETFLGASIVIGHTIAYDIAILQREYELAGRTWRRPRTLDVRELAELAQPTLARYDLDKLCEWLSVEVGARHTAIGDAIATARVFVALVPLLRQRGVRTLAEAEAASRQLADRRVQAAPRLAGEGEPRSGDARGAISRVDSFVYRHRVRDVMSAPAATAPATATVGDTIRQLIERRISSVFVVGDGEPGIVTERDLLRVLDDRGASGLATPIGSIAKKPLQSVLEDDFLYRAIGRIQRLGFRHLAVRNAQGEITGAVTTRNLLRHRATTAIVLGDEIDSAGDVAALAQAWSKLTTLARGLLADGTDPRTIAGVISAEVCVLTRRAAELAEARLAQAGKGPPPATYAVLVLGSAGRGESLLAADQDNAIVYASGEPGGSEDQWFGGLGTEMAAMLDAAGVPFCKGGVMAKNAQWRMSLARWKETIEGWVRRQRPQDLLNVDIFFDGVPVHGAHALGEQIRAHAYDVARQNPAFIKLLSELVRDWRAPLTLFGNIRTDHNGRVDLKKGGLFPLFTSARVLSIRHNVRARSTPERLKGVAAAGIGSPADIEQVIEAHRHLLGVMLDQQLADAAAGVPLSPRVDVTRLAKPAREELRVALGRVSSAIDLVAEGRF